MRGLVRYTRANTRQCSSTAPAARRASQAAFMVEPVVQTSSMSRMRAGTVAPGSVWKRPCRL